MGAHSEDIDVSLLRRVITKTSLEAAEAPWPWLCSCLVTGLWRYLKTFLSLSLVGKGLGRPWRPGEGAWISPGIGIPTPKVSNCPSKARTSPISTDRPGEGTLTTILHQSWSLAISPPNISNFTSRGGHHLRLAMDEGKGIVPPPNFCKFPLKASPTWLGM